MKSQKIGKRQMTCHLLKGKKKKPGNCTVISFTTVTEDKGMCLPRSYVWGGTPCLTGLVVLCGEVTGQ